MGEGASMTKPPHHEPFFASTDELKQWLHGQISSHSFIYGHNHQLCTETFQRNMSSLSGYFQPSVQRQPFTEAPRLFAPTLVDIHFEHPDAIRVVNVVEVPMVETMGIYLIQRFDTKRSGDSRIYSLVGDIRSVGHADHIQRIRDEIGFSIYGLRNVIH